MTTDLPADIGNRPVLVVGAGTLGARIALMFAAGGSSVSIVNRSVERAQTAKIFVDQHAEEVRTRLGLPAPRVGDVTVAPDLDQAVPGAWLVIESLAEDLDLKRQVIAELDRLADPDAVVATSSSSFPSSQLVDRVTRPERLLNIHFLMPPDITPVELMSCGRTDEGLLRALMEHLPQYGLIPFHVQHESVGYIFNRIWAAIKRESLMVVQEGVASHTDVDRIWREVFKSPVVPFRLMDQVGLDVVLDIEEHYARIRPGIPVGPRALLREYLDDGRLGAKSGEGFYNDYSPVP